MTISHEDKTAIVNGVKDLLDLMSVQEDVKRNLHRELYDLAKGDIQRELNQAQAFYDDLKQVGLSAGMVEAEGFLRAMHTAKRILDDALSAVSDTYDESSQTDVKGSHEQG